MRLSHKLPWENMSQMTKPGRIVTLGNLIDNYLKDAGTSVGA